MDVGVDRMGDVQSQDSMSGEPHRSVGMQLRRWLRDSASSRDLGIYIHVPFCRSRCHFCAFYLLIHREDRVRRFLRAIEEEMRWYAREAGLGARRVSSIYLGGGTPTVLSAAQLAAVLSSVRREFFVCPDVEITVEAVPETLTADLIDALRRAGLTRLSLGAQALHETERTRLGRQDAVEGVGQAVDLARAAGVDDLNLDVMYGIPGQTVERWADTLSGIVALKPTHVSCYACTIEPRSRFDVDLHRGALPEPDAALQNRMEDLAEAVLTAAGYVHYEISNYARPGFACRHNLRYWTGEEYVGLGPSAQSYVGGIRFGNVADLNAYARALAHGVPPVEFVERLHPDRQERERVVFGLRLLAGVDVRGYARLARDPSWHRTLKSLIDRGWVRSTPTTLQLTKDGRRFADAVAVELW